MHDKIQVIMDLMKDLQSEMEPDANDIDERLGRKKPEIAVAKIESEVPLEGVELEDMGEEEMELPIEDESPEDKLKNRIMKMRG